MGGALGRGGGVLSTIGSWRMDGTLVALGLGTANTLVWFLTVFFSRGAGGGVSALGAGGLGGASARGGVLGASATSMVMGVLALGGSGMMINRVTSTITCSTIEAKMAMAKRLLTFISNTSFLNETVFFSGKR